MTNFQRNGATSNTQVGRDFESKAKAFVLEQDLCLHTNLRLPIGVDRARLHIPENLRDLIATYGRPDLLRDSEAILRRLRGSSEPDVARVVKMLDESGCGLEQESLILGVGV